jgi:hypothetical protein
MAVKKDNRRGAEPQLINISLCKASAKRRSSNFIPQAVKVTQR